MAKKKDTDTKVEKPKIDETKTQNVEDSIVMNDTIEVNQNVKLGFFTRLMVIGSFVGIGLLIFDKVEPGKISFFKQQEPVKEEQTTNPVDLIAAQMQKAIGDAASHLNSNLEPAFSDLESRLNPIVEQINNSKDEILQAVVTKLDSIKSLNLEVSNAVTSDANPIVPATPKVNIFTNLALEKLNSIISVKKQIENQQSKFVSGYNSAKHKLLNESQNQLEDSSNKNTGGQVADKIKTALNQFVKIKKVDDNKIKLEGLLKDADNLYRQNRFAELSETLAEINSINNSADISKLINISDSLAVLKNKNIDEEIKEIISIIEKSKNVTN